MRMKVVVGLMMMRRGVVMMRMVGRMVVMMMRGLVMMRMKVVVPMMMKVGKGDDDDWDGG